MSGVSMVDGHIDEPKQTTLEFICKNLNKAKLNLEKQKARQGITSAEISNLEEKVMHWEAILKVWESEATE